MRLVFVVFWAALLACVAGQRSTNEAEAQQWFNAYNARSQVEHDRYYRARWNYQTNITDHNSRLSVNASTKLAAFNKQTYDNVTGRFDWSGFRNVTLKRLFDKITNIGTAVLPPAKNREYNQVGNELRRLYSTGRVCTRPNRCYTLGDLSNIMARSRHWEEQEWAWKSWRDASGRHMKDLYERNINFLNEAARMNKYNDSGEHWRAAYESPDFIRMCETLWEQVKPLYQNLHAYVRRKLMDYYKDKRDRFPASRHIPAHILGNMWSQSWQNIMDIAQPYNKPTLDVTDEMRRQNYNITYMVQLSEDFFTSLNLSAMPRSIYKDSMWVRPSDGRQVVCHASAWDFRNQVDFRIKQCTEVSMGWLMTTHHEMGHVAYYLEYKHQPVAFRRGGNPGFHEAVGDIMSLSVSTPDHLKGLGLLPDNFTIDAETDLNFLFRQALAKVAFLPFGYLIDLWRWSVFSGETTKDNYNKKWWDLRCKYQGITPPVSRSEDDFDPGAKNHVPGNTPYIRYFISNIIQFQFHKALCEAANNSRALHRCSIYGSQEAGKKLRDMLSMGSSRKWPEAMQAITGQREMKADGLLEYFRPLMEFLERENRRHNITWDDNCPSDVFVPASTTPAPPTPCPRGGAGVISVGLGLLVCLLVTMLYQRLF